MDWQGQEESTNVEDGRGAGGGGMAPHMMLGGGGLGMMVVMALISWALTGNPLWLLQQGGGGGGGGGGMQQQPLQPGMPANRPPEEEKLRHFVAIVLKDTEVVWTDLFRRQGLEYKNPRLHLFTGQVESACGMAGAAVGPFYCPADEKVYLDLGFFDEMRTRFGAKGDFAQAYVVAHEVGHHVQKLMGITDRVDATRGRASKVEANHLSVRLELQADFFAGVWAHYAQQQFHLDAHDIDDALQCAQAIGDDRLQKQARGVVVPDSFTHGTSAQRAKWFKRGFDTGDTKQGDTFNATDL